MKGVVTMAHFQLMHARLGGYPLRTYTMCHVSDIIFPRRISYKESNYCFCFILASVPHCLFPATVVAPEGPLDEFILEFIWLVICNYALRKIPDLLGTVVLPYD